MSTETPAQLIATLDNPFAERDEQEFKVPGQIASTPGPYEHAMKAGWELQQRPYQAAGVKNVQRLFQLLCCHANNFDGNRIAAAERCRNIRRQFSKFHWRGVLGNLDNTLGSTPIFIQSLLC